MKYKEGIEMRMEKCSDNFIIGDKGYILRELCEDDITDDYIKWMNDWDVVKYTESKYIKHTIENTKEFVRDCRRRDNCLLFGIFNNESGLHVGNIKLDHIHPIYNHADIGLIIGRKELWGTGIATEAIYLCTKYAFENLGLHKVWAGSYENNFGSLRAFEKNGFSLAYVKKDDALFENEYINCCVVEKFNDIGQK